MNKSELSAKIESAQKELKSLFDSAKDANGEFKMSADVLAEAETREAELAELNSKLHAINKLEALKESNDNYFENSTKAVNRLPFEVSDAPKASAKSFGTQVVESGALKAMNQPFTLADVDVKTLMSTGAGWAPFVERAPGVVLSPTRPLGLLDYLPVINTTQNSYKFMLETTYTNNAAEVAESVQGTLASYGEAALALTETTADIRKIPVFLPVSDEQLADVPGIRDYLDARLGYMVRARLEAQVIAGNGSAPNIRGLINVSGVNTQAKGADSVPDAIYKGITLIRVNGETEPNLILMHPSDWQDIRILQNSTGQYLWENPAFPGQMTMFGLPIVLSTAVTQNTAVILDTMYNNVVMRQGVDIQVTNSHSTWFVSGVQAIRADVRAGLACTRAKSICTVTSI